MNGPRSLREPNWEAIRSVDPWPGRYGFGGHIVHIVHMGLNGGSAASVCHKKRCTFAIPNWSFVTCELCLQKLPVAGRLKDGTPVYDARPSAALLALRGITIEELQPGEAPVAFQPLSIIGVKAQDGPPPLTIATAEEYRAYFRHDPPPEWFQPVVTVIPIADAPGPLWPPPYPEQLEPGAVLLEDAIDRSDWRKP